MKPAIIALIVIGCFSIVALHLYTKRNNDPWDKPPIDLSTMCPPFGETSDLILEFGCEEDIEQTSVR